MDNLDPEPFIAKGLLPENLPPVFTSRRLWAALPGQGTGYMVTKAFAGQPCLYNASKRGGHRRTFSVPHPVFVRDQAIFLREHWQHIEKVFDHATGSASRPTLDGAGRRCIRITSHQDLPGLLLRRLSRFRYCLVTDVSRFYHSVYTHVFPWALNGKAAAKADKSFGSKAISGNRMDVVLRQSQSGQSIGIAVGPDTSKVVAEIIMSAVDQRFLERSGSELPSYLRHVDDYWVGGHSVEDCEKHLQNLRLSLREYELDINEAKTRIVPTQLVFARTWSAGFERDIRAALEGRGGRAASDAVSALGKVIEQAVRDGDDGVIKRAIRVTDEQKLWAAGWELLEHFLAQCAVQFHHSLDYVVRVVAWRTRTGQSVDRPLWVEVALGVAERAARLRHDSEVVWALYLMKELAEAVPKTLSDSVLANNSALVLALLAHFPPHGLAGHATLRSALIGTVDGDPYGGPHWPLTLEINHLSRGRSAWSGKVGASPLSLLHSARSSIIDWKAPPRVFSDFQGGGDGPHTPETAIEDFGADYGEGDGKASASPNDFEFTQMLE